MLDEKNKVIFIHIPKCAGKSVEKLICDFLKCPREELLMRKQTSSDCNYLPGRLAHMNYLQYSKYLSDNGLDIDDFNVFTLIRNEEARLRSLYYHEGWNFLTSFNFFLKLREIIAKSGSAESFFYEDPSYYLRGARNVRYFYLGDFDPLLSYLSQIYGSDFSALPTVNSRKKRSLYPGLYFFVKNVFLSARVIWRTLL